jgi:sugar/nucleoside kinase (ribokinase family)
MIDLTEPLIRAVSERPVREPAVTVVADLNYDYIYECPALEAGKEVLIASFSRELAGAGGIVACGLVRLGAKVHFLTELGDDADGLALYSEIAEHGVDRQAIRLRHGARSPFTLIFSEEASGRPRQVATFQGTSREFSVGREDYAPLLRRSELVYSCNYFLLTKLRADIPELFRQARQQGVLTAYDANAGDGWADPPRLELLAQRIHPETDFIFLNEAEAAHLTGREDPRAGAEAVRPPEATAVIKCGALGVCVRHQGRCLAVDAFPLPEPLRDTVGAGDSFQAAFLYFCLCGLPVEHCAVLASANAASTVLQPGGTAGQLDRSGLAAWLAGYRVLDSGHGRLRVERAT